MLQKASIECVRALMKVSVIKESPKNIQESFLQRLKKFRLFQKALENGFMLILAMPTLEITLLHYSPPLLNYYVIKYDMSDFELKVWFIIFQARSSVINQPKKFRERMVIKLQKAFSTACWELNIFPCKNNRLTMSYEAIMENTSARNDVFASTAAFSSSLPTLYGPRGSF
ncbi:hypothetical protein HZH68_014660 [Vespula germanica]|uniref:Uncharacterized protein n=1 Tax=Vespula germanica TaxID=30212 RepID=A0A834J8Z8_VESGE|nr:hypothetical protein HZH68_014660 [Vespula germanica]